MRSLVNSLTRWFSQQGETMMRFTDDDPRHAMLTKTRTATRSGVYVDGEGTQFYVHVGTTYPEALTFSHERQPHEVARLREQAVYDMDVVGVKCLQSGVYSDGGGNRWYCRLGDMINPGLVLEEAFEDVPYDPSPSEHKLIIPDNEWHQHYRKLDRDGVYTDSQLENRYVGRKGDTAPKDWRLVGEQDQDVPESDRKYGRDLAPQAA